MRRRSVLALVVVCGFALAPPAAADSEGSNWAYVAASTTDGTAPHGGHYAKCIPNDYRGDEGATRVYRVSAVGPDVLEDEYDWYATRVYLAGTRNGTSVVRMGPWSRGHRAAAGDLALAFHFGGKLLRSYSTLDIAGRPDNVESSISHYTWARRVIGYCWLTSPQANVLKFGFALEAIDGRIVSFDALTGERLEGWRPQEPAAPRAGRRAA